MIIIKDLKPCVFVQLANGTIFLINSIENGVLTSTLKNGSSCSYVTELEDAILFFNEENAVIL